MSLLDGLVFMFMFALGIIMLFTLIAIATVDGYTEHRCEGAGYHYIDGRCWSGVELVEDMGGGK